MFRFRWPKDVIEGVGGQAECIKSLKTSVFQEAISERDVLLAHCKKLVKKVRVGNEQELEDEKEMFKRLWLMRDEDIPENSDDIKEYRSQLQQEIYDTGVERSIKGGWPAVLRKAGANPDLEEVIRELDSDNKVDAYVRETLVTADSLPFDSYLDDWLEARKNDVEPKTLDDGRLAVAKFAKDFTTMGKVGRRNVKRWFDNQKSKYSDKRLKTYKGHLQAYWTFLKEGLEKAVVDEDLEPFREIKFKTRKNGSTSSSNGWEPFPNLGADIVLLFKEAKQSADHQLADLILLDMYSGMRIEEVCSLKAEDVKNDVLFVSASKTEAGIRWIPIHSQLQQPIERMIQTSKDGYLISNLISNNKYAKRSDAIGKRFGRLKRRLGYGPKHVFHSIRETVVTMLEQAGIEEGVTADIVGHKKQTITYGVYSGGTSTSQRKIAIEKLIYPSY